LTDSHAVGEKRGLLLGASQIYFALILLENDNADLSLLQGQSCFQIYEIVPGVKYVSMRTIS
jgi:hypothetical protein